MRKFLLVALLACGVFAFAAPAHAADGTISGVVTHAADGTPIISMYVTATNTSTGTVSTVAGTAPDGAFSFTLAPGTYDVTTYPYTMIETGVFFVRKTITTTLASGEVKTGQNFVLARRAKFSGHVYASDGVTPVGNATVSFVNSLGSAAGYGSAVTTSAGSFTALPQPTDTTASTVGSYTLSVTRQGYYGKSVTGVVLVADDAITTTNINMTGASTISGTIVDSSGVAVSGALISVVKSNNAAYFGTTNAVGAYAASIYDLGATNSSAIGDYTMTVSKTGYVSKTAAVSITADESSLTGNDFALVAGGTISGVVKNAAGAVLSGAALVATDGLGHAYSATTDTNGAYTIASLFPSSKYTLTVTKTYYIGQKVYSINVISGAAATQNITLPPAKAFTGTVKAKSNSSVLENATISLYKRNRSRSAVIDFSFTTKSDGSFSFRSVSPGKYRIKIVKEGYVTLVQESFTITGDVSGKVFKLDLAGVIRGKITNPSKGGVAGADISVYAMNNGKQVSFNIVSTDENGSYLIANLKNGTYRLDIVTTEYVRRIVDVVVKTGQTKTANYKLATAGSVSGYIIDKITKLPAGGSTVKVAGTSITVTADANGYYILDGIAPGVRKITVLNSWYEMPGQATVTVVAGKTKEGVNFSLTPK